MLNLIIIIINVIILFFVKIKLLIINILSIENIIVYIKVFFLNYFTLYK